MNSYLHSIYLAIEDERPPRLSRTPEWARLSRDYLTLEEAFLSGLEPETRRRWEELQRAAFALDELEREGYIYTVSAKGCFVARRNPQLAREEQLKKIEGEMQRIAELAAAGGISREELTEMFRLLVLETGD